MNNDILVTCEVIFFTRDQKIIIQGNSCIIFYIFTNNNCRLQPIRYHLDEFSLEQNLCEILINNQK